MAQFSVETYPVMSIAEHCGRLTDPRMEERVDHRLLDIILIAWVSEGWAYAKQILMFPQGLSEVGRERRVPTLRESMAGSLGLV